MTKTSVMQRAEAWSKKKEPKYPVIGEPAYVTRVAPLTRGMDNVYIPKVEFSPNEGIFIELAFDSESNALEESANYVIEYRKNEKLSGKY